MISFKTYLEEDSTVPTNTTDGMDVPQKPLEDEDECTCEDTDNCECEE